MKEPVFADKPSGFPSTQVNGAPLKAITPEAVKREFGLPAAAEVSALLALGFAKEPDKPYGGRLTPREFVHAEHFNRSWETGL